MIQKITLLLGLSLILCAKVHADVIVTIDGSRLTGTIQQINEGVILLVTDYAGTLSIAQEKVVSIETDEPLFVRLQSGATVKSAVQRTNNNNLRLISADGTLETDIQRIQSAWLPEASDPDILRYEAEMAKLSRRWLYEATFDMLGKSGNSSEFGIGANFSADLKGPDDNLRFYGSYEYRERDNARTADRIVGGGEYENFPSKSFGWYIRSQLDTDRIRQIDLRSNSAGGASFRLINTEQQSLTARLGLGYEYTTYTTGAADESDGVFDSALIHRKQLNDTFLMRNRLIFITEFDDHDAFRAIHETSLEFPIGSSSFWSVRSGITNEYENKPVAPKRLDTTYFTRMVLSWK